MKRNEGITGFGDQKWFRKNKLLAGTVILFLFITCLSPHVAASSPGAYRVNPVVIESVALLNSEQEVVVPKNNIADLCGDGEGCTLRIIYAGILHSGRYFATNPTAAYWWIENPDMSNSFDDGWLNDGSDDAIFTISGQPVGDATSWCSLYEKTIMIGEFFNTNYILQARAGPSASLTCKLLIGD